MWSGIVGFTTQGRIHCSQVSLLAVAFVSSVLGQVSRTFAGLQMIRATADDSRNSMDVSRKQTAMLCFFQIKI